MNETTTQRSTKELLSSLSDKEKDELLKLVLQEMIRTIQDEFVGERKSTVTLTVANVHQIIMSTIKRLQHLTT